MGVAIFLRKVANRNRFRDLLIDSIATGLGDQALICSGFFQEDFKQGGSYRLSTEPRFIQVLQSKNVRLTTVGIHTHTWKKSYMTFKNAVAPHITIQAKIAPRYHWHAKIYLLKRGSRPIFGIIGSSNMTRSAFSVGIPFNYEADVFLWLDEFEEFTKLIDEVTVAEYSSEVIRLDYDSTKNFGLTIEQRLKALDTDIDADNLPDLV